MLLVAALLFFALVVLMRRQTENYVEQKILGGFAAGFDQYPWFAQFMNSSNEAIKGGALIAPDVVITCAHSTPFDLPAPGSYVRIGGDDWVKVKEVIANQNFYFASMVGSAIADLALVRLEQASRKLPIRLATARPAANTKVVTMGTGMNYEYSGGTAIHSKPFSQARLTYVTGKQALKFLNMESPSFFRNVAETNAIKSAVLHAGIITCVSSASEKMGTCKGDSGGPLIVETPRGPELLGIVHGGHSCNKEVRAKHHYFSFFVSIPYQLAWIKARLNEHNYSVRGMRDATCKYAGRAKVGPSSWKCPSTFPWDAGVWDQGSNTPAGLNGKQCAKNSLCAIYIHNAYVRGGAATNPVHRV